MRGVLFEIKKRYVVEVINFVIIAVCFVLVKHKENLVDIVRRSFLLNQGLKKK